MRLPDDNLKLAADGGIAAVYGYEQGKVLPRPLFLAGVAAGFPSPADDHIDKNLDLNLLMIQNPAATFFVRVAGESMTGAGINDGDILVVDRSLAAGRGKIVIAVLGGELTVKRLDEKNGRAVLAAANRGYPDIRIPPDTGCEIWGVATWVIHRL